MNYETINYEGQSKTLKLEIGYTTCGSYYPATRETPEEYPEFIIEEVFFEDVNIYEILTDEQIDEMTNILNEILY
jgi:hypothetical protein